MNVALVAVDAFVGAFPGVETLVQLQVHKLGEFGWAELALVRLLSRVEPQVGFEIAGAAEPLVTNLTLVGFFSRMYQIVLLEVSQLREALIASLAFKWSLSTVYSEVHLQIGELAKGLGANIAFVLDLPILLFQWVWEGFVTGHIPLTFNEIHGFFTAGGSQHH